MGLQELGEDMTRAGLRNVKSDVSFFVFTSTIALQRSSSSSGSSRRISGAVVARLALACKRAVIVISCTNFPSDPASSKDLSLRNSTPHKKSSYRLLFSSVSNRLRYAYPSCCMTRIRYSRHDHTTKTKSEHAACSLEIGFTQNTRENVCAWGEGASLRKHVQER